MFRRRSSQSSQPTYEPYGAEHEPLLHALRQVLQRQLRSASETLPDPVTEASPDVEPTCAAIEAVLAHGFKSRQFYLFSVHPWSLVEHSEKLGAEEAEAVALARALGSSDDAKLRAWTYVHLNRRTLQPTLSALLADEALLTMMYLPTALLLREEARMMLLDLLRQLSSLSFRLGAAVGLTQHTRATAQPNWPTTSPVVTATAQQPFIVLLFNLQLSLLWQRLNNIKQFFCRHSGAPRFNIALHRCFTNQFNFKIGTGQFK